jgi:hypothetical protein
MAADEFAPCRFGETDGVFFLTFTDFGANGADAVFEEAGFDGGGYGWHGVVAALVEMRAPKLKKKLGYDPEASMFAVSSKDRDALEQVAGLIREAVADPALLREAVGKADPDILEG